MIRFRAGRLALLLTSILSLLAVTAGVAAAASTTGTEGEYADKMTFIGDSVTAGFGYCGDHEDAEKADCSINEEMENNWVRGDTTLKACAPPDSGVPHNACSNDNFNDGKPWTAEPWKAGPHAPDVAYPFQIAARQRGPEKAEVSDWAVTGSTPADWDPDGGVFGSHLDRLKDQYVGMTVGANPLLSYYTYIDMTVKTTRGKCADSTGYVGERGWFSTPWYAGSIDDTVSCLKHYWNKIDQTQHLVDIYTKLLGQNDRVVVMGYYRDCSWSFGNWQPHGNVLFGPASGHDCKSEKRATSKDNPNKISQWDQAVAVGSELNNLIHDAVMQAKAKAKELWPDTNRDDNIVYTQPNEAEWEQHQPKSDNGSWVLLNDTWIHPNKAGAANLAGTVTKAMCEHFDHWCGNTEWNK